MLILIPKVCKSSGKNVSVEVIKLLQSHSLMPQTLQLNFSLDGSGKNWQNYITLADTAVTVNNNV